MTPGLIRIAAVAAGAACLPGLAAAQSQFCLDYVADYCGPLAVNECFVPEFIPEEVPAECIGDVQMLYEMASEYDQQVLEDEQLAEPDFVPAPASVGQGLSFGGNLRDGPGDTYAVVGSLPEGAWVDLEPSGVWSGGYQWFWVNSDFGAAYHWGGLICSHGYDVGGVLQVC
jgi:hypothetical protein